MMEPSLSLSFSKNKNFATSQQLMPVGPSPPASPQHTKRKVSISSLLSCHPLLTFAASLPIMIAAGTAYAYTSYSSAFKDVLGFDQYKITGTITAQNIGSYLSFLGALVFDFLGPRVACALGAILLLVGYGGPFLILSGVLPNSFVLMATFYFLMGQGMGCLMPAAYGSNSKNFSAKHRGKVMGTLSAFYGISASIFSLAFAYIFHENAVSFLGFMTIVEFAVPLVLGVLFLSYSKPRIAPLPPTVLVEEASATINIDETSTLIEKSSYVAPADIDMNKTVWKPADATPIRMLLSLDFWLISIMYFSHVGAGLTVINNLGDIVLSYGGTSQQKNLLVIVLSLASATGRIVMGLSSDLLRSYTTRVGFLNIAITCMCIIQILLAFADVSFSMWIVIVMFGFTYGSGFALIPAFLTERYGTKWMGMNLTFSMMGPIAATFLLASLLVSFVYQYSLPPGATKCFGKHCFRPTFFVVSFLCFIAVLVGLVLQYRTRLMYYTRKEYFGTVDIYRRSKYFVEEQQTAPTPAGQSDEMRLDDDVAAH